VDRLRKPLSTDDLAELGKKVMGHPGLIEKWLRFLSRARPEDRFWSYSDPNIPDDGLPVPVARVRGKIPVAWVAPIDNLKLAREAEEAAREAEEAARAAEQQFAHEQARLERRRSTRSS
jgi:hypothetical protein